MKKNILRISAGIAAVTLIVITFFPVFSAPARKGPSRKDLETIAKLTSAIISKQHYRQQKLDDKLSEEIFLEYFKSLDPLKIYFTQEDIKSFDTYRHSLDEMTQEGNLEFAFKVYDLLRKRLDEYQDYSNATLKKGFDFTKDENYVFDRSKSDWVKDMPALRNLWRQKLKNDLLTFKLMERAQKLAKKEAKKAKPDKGKKIVHSSWNDKTPETRVKNRVHQYVNYLKKNRDIDVAELFLSSMARVYDPHSAYMSPATEEDFNMNMRLSLVGIGALLSSEDGYTKIVRLIKGGPAERDGRLNPEDRIIAVAQDGKEPVDIIDVPLNRVVEMIRGPKNTTVHLTVLKGDKGIKAIPTIISIIRDEVKLTEQEAKGKVEEIKDANGKVTKVGIITLPSFYMDFKGAMEGKPDYKSTTRDVKKILDDFEKQNVDGVLLDLRANGGGSLLEAITLSGLFIKDGPVVQIKSNPGVIDIKYDTDADIYYDGPLVVLINKLSASASEIFAGAIKDYNRGILIGDSHTHGKGTVQTVYELDQFLRLLGITFPAGSVKFTNAQFYRISGSSTQQKGVQPHIVFPSFTDSMKIGEKDLDHSLPWDSIGEVKHDDYKSASNEAAAYLKKLSALRRNKDNRFVKLTKDIDDFRHYRERKKISLNENKRWNEYLREKKLQEEQSKLMRLEAGTGEKVKNDSKDKGDLYLNESKSILVDYILFLNNRPKKLPMTAKLDKGKILEEKSPVQ